MAQRVTLRAHDTKLASVFQLIKKQTGYAVIHNNPELAALRVDVMVTDATVEEAVSASLKGHPYSFKIVANNIFIRYEPTPVPAVVTAVSESQQRTVTGTVHADTDEPLEGVTIQNADGQTLGFSDAQGNFRIRLSGDDTQLTFTIVGYQRQEVALGSSNTLTVRLKPAISDIDEVVVVGYGQQKKVNLTGAVSTIAGEEFEERPVTQLTQALQGSVPNLNVVFGSGQPGTSGSVNVRGNTSINGGGPLILIDGVLGTLDRINVNDVESVTVLKDASAAAVYGARGAFGVILVTTKTGGKDGSNNITYSTNIGFTQHATNTDFITSGYWNAKINDDAMYNALGYRTTRYTDEDYEELLARVNDKTENPDRPWVMVKQDASGRDIYRYYANFDWFNYLFDDNRPKQDHNLTLSGRSGKTSYSLSGAMSKEQGVFNIQPDYFRRQNLRAKVATDIKDWLTVSNNTHFFKSSYDWNGFSTNFNDVDNNVSNSPTYHYHAMYVPRNPDGTLTGYSGINSYPIGYGLHNGLESGTMRGYNKGTELTNLTEAVFKIAKGLTVTGNYTYREYRSDYSYRQTRQYYSKYPGVMELSNLGALNQDRLTETMSKYHWHLINVFGTYQTQFGQHNLTAMAGFNQEDRTYKRVGGVGQELLSESLNDLDLVIGERQFSAGADEWAVRGGFYRLNYNFAGKYLLEASGRYDGTSRFPQRSRFGFFPSFSAGWRVSEEAFFEPLKNTVNNLKIRYSYGTLGNQEVATYGYISSMGTDQINYLVNGQRLNVTNPPSPVAPTLTWESITTSNIGLDVNLFKNRFSVEADYYTRDTRKMLSTGRTLPEVFGAAEPRENAADLRTKGFDLMVSWQDEFQVASKPFSYTVRGILSDYTSKITRFSNPAKLLNTFYEGQQLGDIWGYQYAGFFKTTEEAQAWAAEVNQDQINRRRVQAPTAELRMLQAGDIKILDLNGDGIINQGLNTLDDPGDRRIIGNSQPRYSFGLTLGGSWNGIDISVFFQGIGRQNWYPNLESQAFWSVYARPYDSFIPSDFPDKIWSPENPNAYFPFLRGYTAQNSELSVANDMYLQDLAYCKLRNVTVGYSLPTNWINRVKLTQVRFFATGENLHTWTKLKSDYIDPEQVMTDNTGRSYPFGRVFSFGAQISF
ncbi:SusC/RagA family TonB-linked outer membrane protein [Parapedobacter pyrenivorans]|uniref:SusC/RagA family TonB-linked outer membrane protein n=1 Tax=Parapedobacter pyrenivorans TaxID=1305674 RepID=A0A917MAV1_9SPHI|nr:TonB-dependent receptor [Parapedobacter pyrenivorans]GGG90059.1 SusC/RagA family TonB-linked outer membrane protein [Parapedobacter pyrenivorans]